MLRARLLAHALLLLGPHSPHALRSPFNLVHGAANKGSVARLRTRTGRCKTMRLGARAVYHAWSVWIVVYYHGN